MTAIVGLVFEGKVYIGADSAGSDGHSVTIRKDPKVFRNGNYLFGFTGSFRMGQLLNHAFVPPKYTGEVPLDKFMTTIFVDEVRKCLKDGGYAFKSNEQELAGTFLVGTQGRLFLVDTDYQVGESAEGYDAVGCGNIAAAGAMFATKDVAIEPKERVQLALEAAAYHVNSVRGPFTVLEV